MGLFGKTEQKSPREQAREWTSKLRKQTYVLDRQIRGIQREEEKVKASLKQAAKKGDKETCYVLAKELVRSRKAVQRIHMSKAQINSISMNVTQQLATMRVAGAIQKSTDIMKCMQRLMSVHEISETMQEMSKEMMKMGIIDEMLEETLDDTMTDDVLEEEVQDEVDKILFDLTAGQLGKAPDALSDSLPVNEKASVSKEDVEDDEEMSAMQERLMALKS